MEITITLQEALMLIAVGFLAGIINTLAGGGSLLTLPLLIFMGLPSTVANATNRVAILIQNIFGVSGFKSKGVSSFKYSGLLAIAAALGAALGAKLAIDISDELFKRILAIVMIMVVIMTVFRPFNRKDGAAEDMSRKKQIIGFIVFFFLGIYGGFIQAGIGFLIIAALTTINGFNLIKTNAVKLFVALTYTLMAVIIFALEGKINWQYGLTLAIGNSIGAWISSRWSVKAGDKYVRWFLLVAVVGLAIKLWFF
ncbi:MAG: sulfite exporter TauE/SafE family protein [bacterium]|nr:sulfite exporter TauE/SafE family protein [bacterium]